MKSNIVQSATLAGVLAIGVAMLVVTARIVFDVDLADVKNNSRLRFAGTAVAVLVLLWVFYQIVDGKFAESGRIIGTETAQSREGIKRIAAQYGVNNN